MTGISLRDRFESRIRFNFATMCWLWSGGKNGDGYGSFHANGNKKAHQVAYELYVGEIPKGMLVLHKCDNPACVNPDHLSLGTHQQNMADMKAKGRGNGPKGEMAHKCKLTKEQVKAIRADKRSSSALAKEYGVHQSQICRIKSGGTWKWL
jgi:hypothetical protein